MKHQKHNTRGQLVNQVRICFTNKSLTGWGGVCTLVAKFLAQINFKGWVEENVPVEEKSPNSRGIYEKVLAQFLTCLTGGYRFSHLQWWTHGIDAVCRSFGVAWLPQAASVLTRFWGKINCQGLSERLGEGARSLTRGLLEREGIQADNLILDSSVCIRYGRQEGAKRGYNPKKPGRASHHPLKAGLGCGYVVNMWNRSGDTNSGHQAVSFHGQTCSQLPAGFRIRNNLCDSGFYDIEFIEYLEGRDQTYIISAPLSPILQKRILRLGNWEPVARGIEVAEFQFQHLDAKWKKPRRYVVIRQEIASRPRASGKQPLLFKELEETRGFRYSLMITNDEKTAAVEIWRQYRPRANEENLIKDLQEGYGWDAFNLKNFWATEAVMIMNGMVFHNLIHYLNRNVFKQKDSLVQMKTLRMKYFSLPAILEGASDRPVIRLGVQNKRLRCKLRFWLEKIAQIPFNLNCIAVENKV